MPENRIADLNAKLTQYEMGHMPFEQQVTFFQELIDSGLAWQLQGHYGRTAIAMIQSGVCRPMRDRGEHFILVTDAELGM